MPSLGRLHINIHVFNDQTRRAILSIVLLTAQLEYISSMHEYSVLHYVLFSGFLFLEPPSNFSHKHRSLKSNFDSVMMILQNKFGMKERFKKFTLYVGLNSKAIGLKFIY